MTRSGEYFFIRFFSRPYKFCQKIISTAYENKFFLSSSNVICWTVNSEFWTEAALETSNEMWSYWPPASYQNHDRVCIHNIKFRCRYEIKKNSEKFNRMFPFQEFYSSGATRRHRNMYLHQSQDPCLPQDRKRRQIHDTFCVPRNCKLQEKRGKLMLPSILIYIYIFKKKISFIFIFSSLLDIRTLFEIYFWPCSINSRYMLQLPVLRHCFSS